MFEKPQVGQDVRVITDWTDDLRGYASYIRRRHTHIGTVVPDNDFDHPLSFNMTTGKKHFPIASIDLAHVVELVKLEDGTVAAQSKDKAIDNDIESWSVEGSTGNTYIVTRRKDQWSCTCPGFGFRRDCKHIKGKQKEVLIP